MHPSSAEYTVSSTYLDWMTALPGIRKLRIIWILPKRAGFWMKTIMVWPNPRNASSNIWPCANSNRIPKGDSLFCRSSGHGQDIVDIPSRGLWGANLCACHWAVCMMRRKSAVIAAHTSALCPDALFRTQTGGIKQSRFYA